MGVVVYSTMPISFSAAELWRDLSHPVMQTGHIRANVW